MKKITQSLLFVVLTLVLVSCSPEYVKTVKNYARQNDSTALLLIKPNNIYFKNFKLYDDSTLAQLPPQKVDSALKAKSNFLSWIDKDIIHRIFIDKLLLTLSETNLRVYTEDYVEEFEKNNVENKYIVDIQQLEFDEYYDKVVDLYKHLVDNYGRIDTIIYTDDNYLNAFSANMWVEFHYPHADTLTKLFANNYITDYHEGYYYAMDGEIIHDEERIALTDDNIIEFLDIIAVRYANYIYDLVMNDYVTKRNSIHTEDAGKTLHYDFHTGRVTLVDESYRFVPAGN